MNPYTTLSKNDTICALSTPPGISAIGVIRLSGPEAVSISNLFFKSRRSNYTVDQFDTHTAHFGSFATENEVIDDVVLTVFRNPHSYTGDDIIEISCHGSEYILQRVLEVLIDGGARMAREGEFTLRAFLNGRLDLSQAEAVADLISSRSKVAHDLAMSQMRGGFSQRIKDMRTQLLDLASLLELELDFSEEDVEFADRSKLKGLMAGIIAEMADLASSFSLGNVIKKGIPVAIIGKPNVGKSTLLNALLNEERAIVSEIPGTTRDTIEDTFTTNGITFRFIDTAGLRSHTTDAIETIGISRTYEKIKEASVILYLFDISTITVDEIDELRVEFRDHIDDPEKNFLLIGNKTDLMVEAPPHITSLFDLETIFISAKRKENINLIIERLLKTAKTTNIGDQAIVSNARHYDSIISTLNALKEASAGLDANIPTDLIATDIRSALHHLGEITGEVTTEDILGNIFGKFCIGK
ncbi:MAG: tRNA uridine-5-carboxymethylaminomethyl(34) synthesis GTPase MnmE [Lentimicrobiaceae bacterium]|jgi:tRNA modification GTPase